MYTDLLHSKEDTRMSACKSIPSMMQHDMLLNMLQARANNMKKPPCDLTAESVAERDDSMLP